MFGSSPGRSPRPMDHAGVNAYGQMHLVQDQMGNHSAPDGIVEMMGNLVRSESMDITNDPRFFSGNVLDKRMAAFTGLAVVSTLFTGNALGDCFAMKKDWDFHTIDGVFQFCGFTLMNAVLFFNILAAYVGVAQQYLTYRLMTAGPTGFEIASVFYLNPNIAFWRHAAVKKMLLSIPLFLLASSFKMFVKIDREMPGALTTAAPETLGLMQSRVLGISVIAIATFCLWFFVALLLFYVNYKHLSVFKENYTLAKELERPLLTHIKMMSERGHSPDV